MLTTLVSALVVLVPQSRQDTAADQMLNLATAGQPIVASVVVDAPVKEVWKAWTTNEGITSWMVAKGEIELKVGGVMRTSYNPQSNLHDQHTIENTILAYDPERMLTIKVTKFPNGFPFPKAVQDMWTVIYLEPVDSGKTKVIVRGLGFTHDQESIQMRGFFKQGNQVTVDALAAHFNTKR